MLVRADMIGHRMHVLLDRRLPRALRPERLGFLDWTTILADRGLTERETRALDLYFRSFAQVTIYEDPDQGGRLTLGRQECLSCDAPMVGPNGTWTMDPEGDGGYCAVCRWPGRHRHDVRDAHGESVILIEGMALQFHPVLTFCWRV